VRPLSARRWRTDALNAQASVSPFATPSIVVKALQCTCGSADKRRFLQYDEYSAPCCGMSSIISCVPNWWLEPRIENSRACPARCLKMDRCFGVARWLSVMRRGWGLVNGPLWNGDLHPTCHSVLGGRLFDDDPWTRRTTRALGATPCLRPPARSKKCGNSLWPPFVRSPARGPTRWGAGIAVRTRRCGSPPPDQARKTRGETPLRRAGEALGAAHPGDCPSPIGGHAFRL
jgi:hypothetical protein